MPNYKPLTPQEKQAIIDRHHFIVDKMNQTLGGTLHYEDEALLKKLDNPETVAIYRMNEEFKRRDAAREAIRNKLEAKYGASQVPNNPVMRFFNYSLRLGGTAKDNEYNEKIYQEAINHPEKFAYRSYSKLLSVDARDLYAMKGNKQAQAEYYMEHQELCMQGYCIQGVASNEATQATRGLKNAMTSMRKPFENMVAYGNIVKQGGIDSLACPTLTSEQAALSMMTRELFQGNPYPELTEAINGKMGMNSTGTPDEFIDGLKNEGIDINEPDLFLKYKAVLNNPERTEVNFDEIFLKHNPRAIIERRSDEEIFQIKAFNKVFQEKYVGQFQSRMASKLNQLIFDANQIEDEHKGGWFERNIWHSTSPEWTAFIEAFKNYNNPDHPDYARKDILRSKGQDYLDHKKEQGFEYLKDMKGTSLKRATLVTATLDTIKVLDAQEDSIREDINIEVDTGLKGKVGLIINADEVDIFENKNEIKEDDPMDLEDDLEKAVDDTEIGL